MNKAGSAKEPGTPRAPNWEARYPGRFEFELDALRCSGAEPEIDASALAVGRLVLTFDWRLDDKTTLRLRAVYPDSFPHIRPQVFLLGGLESPPVRHRAPIGNNLCLLGRNSRQWVPSWTLSKLLSQQLQKALSETGDEDPQGEPAEFWWNAINPTESYCLIDSRWDLSGTNAGTLVVRFVYDGYRRETAKNHSIRIPTVRAFVSEVRDQNANVLHRWNGPLPADLKASNQSITVPWVRIDEIVLPAPDLGAQVAQIQNDNPHLANLSTLKITDKVKANLFAVVHTSELSFKKNGQGWFFIFVVGDKKAFSANPKYKSALTTLPVYRAGLDDIGHRVPAVRVLRDTRILVVGVGAIGAPIATEFVRNECNTLHLIDNDSLEPGNSVRWPLGTTFWGKGKVDALKTFLEREYPNTTVLTYRRLIGQADTNSDEGDDEVLNRILGDVDIVIDASTSHGVTTLLAERCMERHIPLISVFATPTLEGGIVARYVHDGGCPNCLECAWHNEEIQRPPGWEADEDSELIQPPGCSERTFSGADYDLRELSLQAVRCAIETLANRESRSSQVQTLQMKVGAQVLPRWRVDDLPKHCQCCGIASTGT